MKNRNAEGRRADYDKDRSEIDETWSMLLRCFRSPESLASLSEKLDGPDKSECLRRLGPDDALAVAALALAAMAEISLRHEKSELAATPRLKTD